MNLKFLLPVFLLVAIKAQSEPVMVATVNSVPVYVRHSQLDGVNNDQVIADAIEGELSVQSEPMFEINSGSEGLRSELERMIAKQYPNRNDFHKELKDEGMTYEDYIYEQRRVAALATTKAWILEYIKLTEARLEGKKTAMAEIQKAFSEEEKTPEYRARVWKDFIQEQKGNAQIVTLKK